MATRMANAMKDGCALDMIVASFALLIATLASSLEASLFETADPVVIGYVCDEADSCCAPYVTMARLAVSHVNARIIT